MGVILLILGILCIVGAVILFFHGVIRNESASFGAGILIFLYGLTFIVTSKYYKNDSNNTKENQKVQKVLVENNREFALANSQAINFAIQLTDDAYNKKISISKNVLIDAIRCKHYIDCSGIYNYMHNIKTTKNINNDTCKTKIIAIVTNDSIVQTTELDVETNKLSENEINQLTTVLNSRLKEMHK